MFLIVLESDIARHESDIVGHEHNRGKGMGPREGRLYALIHPLAGTGILVKEIGGGGENSKIYQSVKDGPPHLTSSLCRSILPQV